MKPNEVGQIEAIWMEPKVLEITGLSRSTIWRQERKGNFPKRIKISERAVGWPKSQILAWLENLKAT